MTQFTPPTTGMTQVHEAPAKTSILAVISLIAGILGFCTAGIAGLIGVILGVIALMGINNSAGRVKGSGLAVGGIAAGACSIVFGFLFMGLMLPALAQARLAAKNVHAATQLRQVGIGSLNYANDHNDRLMPARYWVEALRPQEPQINPLLEWPGKLEDGRAFAMNVKLDGVPTTKIRGPVQTVLIFECAPGSPLSGGPELLPSRPRSRTGYLILFADGSVQNVKPDRLNTLVWEP